MTRDISKTPARHCYSILRSELSHIRAQASAAENLIGDAEDPGQPSQEKLCRLFASCGEMGISLSLAQTNLLELRAALGVHPSLTPKLAPAPAPVGRRAA